MGILQFKKQVLYPGVILGVTLIFLEFTALFLGLMFNKYLSNIYTIIVFLSVSIAIKKYREFNEGQISFLNAFKTGFFICAISGALWSLYRFMQYSLRPYLVSEIIRTNKEKIQEEWMSTERLEFMLDMNEKMTTPATLAFLNTFILSMLFGGSILSLFLAFVFRRDKQNSKQQ